LPFKCNLHRCTEAVSAADVRAGGKCPPVLWQLRFAVEVGAVQLSNALDS
jgi:hypothetical protein